MELPRNEKHIPESEKTTPCAGCGNPSECAIWGTTEGTETPLCYPCCSDWYDNAPKGHCGAAAYMAYTSAFLAAKRKARAA